MVASMGVLVVVLIPVMGFVVVVSTIPICGICRMSIMSARLGRSVMVT